MLADQIQYVHRLFTEVVHKAAKVYVIFLWATQLKIIVERYFIRRDATKTTNGLLIFMGCFPYPPLGQFSRLVIKLKPNDFIAVFTFINKEHM